MSWYHHTFNNQYRAAKRALRSSSKFDGDWKKLVETLDKLLADSGFDVARARSLDELRKKISRATGQGPVKTGRDQVLLHAAQAGTGQATAIPDAAARQRVAALKFLEHVYLLKQFGNHKVWLHSLPNKFDDWAYRDLNVGDAAKIKRLLQSRTERFSSEQKRNLSDASQIALRWCHLTLMVLSTASGRRARKSSTDLVKRWFAEPGVDDKTIATMITTLTTGFKAITGALNRGEIVLTDFPALRSASSGSARSARRSEAFVFNQREAVDVVYVEDGFFSGKNTLTGQANWARILVHELSHILCKTEDVEPGPRYSWYGIGPNPNFPSSECIKNADSWAFFAADCGNALSESERNTALKVV